MADICPVSANNIKLGEYRKLFLSCFPGATHLNEEYLDWLYLKNPEGPVIGFDAWEGKKLCAHYACIPASVEIFGKQVRALLSLNTSTHPDYRGQGLFTKLAECVYEVAAEKGYKCVYGIANASSTPGFVSNLGFTCMGSLDARIGVGKVTHISSMILEKYESGILSFRRLWSSKALQWRFANPHNPVMAKADNGWILAKASSRHSCIHAYAEIPEVAGLKVTKNSQKNGLHLFLGIIPGWEKKSGAYISIPKFLRPSPLNFIFRDLSGQNFFPPMESIRLSFLDFDAY